MRTDTSKLCDILDRLVDEDPLKLRDAFFAALGQIDATCDGARRQMEQGDYRLCPPDMLRIYVHDAVRATLGLSDNAVSPTSDLSSGANG
ncbi:MAG TPA: hypothetical protein VFB19_18465 [Mycobacterium sp.]|nr:hypothetical protein [Mycobacterium sp.]